MKLKRFIAITLILFIIFINSSCGFNNENKTNNSNKNTNNTIVSSNKNQTNDDEIEYTIKYDRNFIEKNDIKFPYSTGNFIKAEDLEFYRATLFNYDKTNFIELLPNPNYKYESIDSAIYNINPIANISYIAITYKSNSNSKIYYSINKSYNKSYDILANNDYKRLEYNLDGAKYFKITSSTSSLYIKSIEIALKDTDKKEDEIKYDGFRINPKLINNEIFVSGETSKKIPIIKYQDATYKITEYKEYTYYDHFSWLKYYQDNNEILDYDKSVLTDPIDVANYYLLFNTWPVNYLDKDDAINLYQEDIIKDDIRCVSTYSRTDGYVNSIPLNKNNGPILYYELDLKLSYVYSPTNRDVGRLVIFTNGFDSEGYNNAPVIVYTDDHYKTFKEYNNAGSFLERFNAEGSPTPYIWNNVYTYDYIKD